ncbi:MAG TPA: Rieske 2Fe-2S domain-containing protein [Candidatus Lustribacter sp.]|nr:Rieske 2Fe-2S domain-containing protein [Candidatus Lustribacter sp.]
MLTAEENERLTRVGPGTPMGALMRRYWQPALLSEELPQPDCPPVRVRLLGEDLVAFRDTSGGVGLVDAYCPHRRAPMFFGRNEECGLRCVYHGWKFDRTGACVDMPSEPPDSLFKTKVRIAAYPTHEAGGMIWAYFGPPELQPPAPDYELLRAPETHRHVSKTFESANWLQALEGGIDTAHSSFVHNQDIHNKNLLRNADTAPRLEVEKTPYGFRYAGIRSRNADEDYVRVYHYLMPAQQLRGGVTDAAGGKKTVPSLHGHVWVPIDDEHTWTFNWLYSYDPAIPLGHDNAIAHEIYSGRGPDDYIPGTYRLKRNPDNDYLIDRELQRNKTYTGIKGINTQDYALQEGMGPICDRTNEHLGTSDRAIIAARQLLFEALDAVERGEAPRGTNPEDYKQVRPVDMQIPSGSRWQEKLEPELVARF